MPSIAELPSGPDQRRSPADALALYIHWPFCISKCPYCDFNSHVRSAVDQERWRAALLADLRHEAAKGPRRLLSSIFFGGGTPSLMPPATVAALIGEAARLWGFAPGIEITLEANPSSVEAARFVDLAAAGVNRVSLGVQALEDSALAFLGRAHDTREALTALEIAQAAFARVSFDLIYARPGQGETAWAAELDRALGFGTGHLSLYQLTIEPGTRFATLAAQGKLTPVDPELAADLFEGTRAATAGRGLPAYEISNHARPGEESRHNLAYWHYDEYLGIGPGAHGRRNATATLRHRKPETWLCAVEAKGHGIAEEEALGPATRATEALLMGLRLAEGVPVARVAAALDRTAATRLAGLGLLDLTDDHLRVRPAGMLVLDRILAEIAV